MRRVHGSNVLKERSRDGMPDCTMSVMAEELAVSMPTFNARNFNGL